MKKEKDKKPKFKEKLDKPTPSLDFDALLPVIVDRALTITDFNTKLVFMRNRSDGDIYSFAFVKKIDADGAVTLWDASLEQWFIFNIRTDVSMAKHLKIYDKSAKKKAPSAELLAHIEEGVEDAKQGRTVDYVRCGFCDLVLHEGALHVCDLLPGRHIA